MNYYNRILFLAPLLIFNYSFSQDYNAQQKKLEAQKLSIKKEIEKINVLVSENILTATDFAVDGNLYG